MPVANTRPTLVIAFMKCMWKIKAITSVGALALLLPYLILQLQPYNTPQPLYQILGVPQTADATETEAAYNRLHALWMSKKPEPLLLHNVKEKLIDIQHAYDILSDERRRRNYDTFRLDELHDAVQVAKKQHGSTSAGNLQFPLWQVDSPARDPATISLTSQNFGELVLESDDLWVIQLYSETSIDSQGLLASWGRVATLLDGVAKVGRVDIGQLPLSALLAEKTLYRKQPIFSYGLPEVVVFPSSCRRFDCVVRYRGLKTVEALVDWLSTSLLKLPRILYYSSKTLMKDVIQGAGPHKVKVITFSGTGDRAAPYIRRAAKKYQEHAVFAMVLWQEQNATFWESREGVESAPAVVFLKDPGLNPVIYHGDLNSSTFETLMEEHKTFVLPQLQSISAAGLGCDARGDSMAGNSTSTWYCVIVAGRTGLLLSQMRGKFRRVLHNLTNTELPPAGDDVARHLLAAEVLRSKRLSLSWLDGEKQKEFCYFYLHSPTMFEACGPRRYGETDDVPKICLVRYQRNLPLPSSEEHERLEKKRALRGNNIWLALLEDNDKVASQLVSKYNGSAETAHIVQWISQMVYEGDNHKLPSFSGKMPALVPEEKLPFWAHTKEIVADGQARAVQNSQWFTQAFSPYSSIDMQNLAPVAIFLAIFFASHFLLHRTKSSHLVSQDASAGAGGHSISE